MRLAKVNRTDLEFIAVNMRQRDKDEIYATRWSDNPIDLTEAIMLGGEFGWVSGTDDGTPVAAFGAVPAWEGVWEVWMMATDRWPEVALSTTKFIKRVVIPALEKSGYHRLQCRSLSTHHVAHKWLETLGAYKESDIYNYGRRGEAFVMYCWTRQSQMPLSDTTSKV